MYSMIFTQLIERIEKRKKWNRNWIKKTYFSPSWGLAWVAVTKAKIAKIEKRIFFNEDIVQLCRLINFSDENELNWRGFGHFICNHVGGETVAKRSCRIWSLKSEKTKTKCIGREPFVKQMSIWVLNAF